MHVSHLTRFSDFAGLDRDVLTSVARCSRRVRLPAGRWVVRHGRRPKGRLYLLEGQVSVSHRGLVCEGDAIAAERLYPGAGEIRTHTTSVLLHVDWDAVAFLCRDVGSDLFQSEPGWEAAFLGSPMMQQLPVVGWQRVLGSLRPVAVKRGEPVVQLGEPGSDSFVLAEGRAAVHLGRRRLAVLGEGAFFGEDAPATGEARNASVTMLERGKVMRMPEHVVTNVLLPRVVQVVEDLNGALPLNIGAEPAPGSLHFPLLELRDALPVLQSEPSVGVIGGSLRQRLLAGLILEQRGVTAAVLSDRSGGDRPAISPGSEAGDGLGVQH